MPTLQPESARHGHGIQWAADMVLECAVIRGLFSDWSREQAELPEGCEPSSRSVRALCCSLHGQFTRLLTSGQGLWTGPSASDSALPFSP